MPRNVPQWVFIKRDRAANQLSSNKKTGKEKGVHPTHEQQAEQAQQAQQAQHAQHAQQAGEC